MKRGILKEIKKPDEVATGVYKAWGSDAVGRPVEMTGVDPDDLIERCREAALQLLARGS
jgi:hypothetical protein